MLNQMNNVNVGDFFQSNNNKPPGSADMKHNKRRARLHHEIFLEAEWNKPSTEHVLSNIEVLILYSTLLYPTLPYPTLLYPTLVYSTLPYSTLP